MILVKLNNRITRALIDTGADRSFIRTGLFKTQVGAPLRVLLGDGSERIVKQEAQLHVGVGRVEARHRFHELAALPEESVLGLDFQVLYDLRIQPALRRVVIGDEEATIPFIGQEATTGEVRARRQRTLPPRSLAYVEVESLLSSGRCYATEELESSPFLLGAGLHEGPPRLLRIANVTTSPLLIAKGQLLASAERVPSPVDPGRVERSVDFDFRLGPSLLTTEVKILRAMLQEYGPRLFATEQKPFGRTTATEHKILLEERSRPIYQRVRQTSPEEKKIVREEVGKMLDQGVIRPSSSPWASPIVLVRKKDGSVRFCVDYRKLNDITVKDVFPLPRTSDLLESFQGMRIFTTLDAAAGYWQIPLSQNAIAKSAFISSEGLFEFVVMPFGLCNAPATFQRMMNVLLAGVNGISCLVYLDDIIVFSKTFKEHLAHLREVFDRLVEASILLKPSKCRFGVDNVEYLGHIVSAKGISPDPKKIEKLRTFPAPTTVTELKSFLGFAGYYRRFIRNFAMIAEPLFLLLREDTPFVWGPMQDEAFKKLLSAIESDAVLMHPRFDQPFIVDADASGFALGGVLSQVVDGMERPIAFTSQHLTKAEQKWHIREKEALAIIRALESFQHFLRGSTFQVRTDHSSLTWLLEAKTGRLGRWALRLLEFGPFSIVHRSGKLHTNVDALSRIPTPADAFPDRAVFGALQGVTPLPSREALIKAQALDSRCREGLKQVLAKSGPFKLVEGVLAIRTPSGPRIVLPASLAEQVILGYHEGPTHGHFGVSRTSQKVLEKFHCPKMKDEVSKVLQGCLPCQQRKARAVKHVQLASRPSRRPWATVAADFCGPYSSTGPLRFVLVIVDHFTKWVELIPTRTQEAQEVAQAFYERIICRHGCPCRFLTDNGSCFRAGLVENLCSLFQIRKIYSSAYYPQGDGVAERFMQAMNNSLAILSRHHPSDWPKYVPGVAFAYNTSVHASTGASPFFLNTGRVPSFPEEGWLKDWGGGDEVRIFPQQYKEYLKSLEETIRHAQGHARQAMEAAWTRQSRTYKPDSKRVEVGDQVLVRLTEVERNLYPIRKLAPRWSKPSVVREVLTNGKTSTLR